eukprot:CAMPEP_0115831486 /NCGR_PEP_ID=MMETSP0287-20121206/2164_1 /TAXON_ID=412157 /ORGANISM="Chrysochromulina rotalis, Strain UIO044" /LENGTH=61 /DNA_ID=CAMNT_0003284835 /DNA_START=447 /DNA_END=632 /DNA_ORIENTATION=-
MQKGLGSDTHTFRPVLCVGPYGAASTISWVAAGSWGRSPRDAGVDFGVLAFARSCFARGCV